jgi:broad specificity phosphatase PhoE
MTIKTGSYFCTFAKDTPLKRALRSAWITLVVRLSGEPRTRFGERVAESAREITRRHPDQRVLVVIHMAVRSNMLARLVDGDPAAWVRYDGWPAGSFTESELAPDGKARLIQMEISNHLSTLRSNP